VRRLLITHYVLLISNLLVKRFFVAEQEKIDLDRLRREFSQRLNVLIEEDPAVKKLENFVKKSGVSSRQLSQWRNPKYPNWPNIESLLRICLGADVSPVWLLLGFGPRQLSPLTDKHVERVLQFMEGCGEMERRMIAEGLGGQEKQKAAASGQERKEAIAFPPRKKTKGHR